MNFSSLCHRNSSWVCTICKVSHSTLAQTDSAPNLIEADCKQASHQVGKRVILKWLLERKPTEHNDGVDGKALYRGKYMNTLCLNDDESFI